jgi:putative DNA primase/helicase
MKNNITPDLIRAALQHIPANLARDEWARVGMAIKSEYPDETGRDLFTEWSATADGYDLKGHAVNLAEHQSGRRRGHWHAVAPGQTKRLCAAQARPGTQPSPTPQRLAQLATKGQSASDLQSELTAHATLPRADEALGTASDQGESAYLTRKGVQAHGVRFTPDGWVLVPMRDAGGQLWNLQRIAKRHGRWHRQTVFEGRPQVRAVALVRRSGPDPAAPVLLVAEGYATAASVHQATGRPVLWPLMRATWPTWQSPAQAVPGRLDRGLRR